MEASEPKWVNPVLNIIGVNSLRLGGLQLSSITEENWAFFCNKIFWNFQLTEGISEPGSNTSVANIMVASVRLLDKAPDIFRYGYEYFLPLI